MKKHTPSSSYEKAPTTDRSAEVLAHRHGFENVAELAEALPQGARVLDVGAGASPFGKEVAALRPDIAWTNFDYSYQDPVILAGVAQCSPSNVEHIAGDARNLAEVYEHGSFDAVFSYWLLPHLSLDDIKPAADVAGVIYKVTKPGGLMSVGPRASRKRIPSDEYGSAIQFVKDESLAEESCIKTIVLETRLSKPARYAQKLANEVATPFFGTSRYLIREGDKRKMLDPRSGEYISPYTTTGLKVIGSLAVDMVRYAAGRRES